MKIVTLAINRLRTSAVAWSWVFNFFRLGAGLILLPLVLNKLPTADLGMYYVLLSLAALVPLVDFGFSPTIGRFVSYAMGGADSIQPHGVSSPGNSGRPNYTLLWQLLATTQRLYRYLTLALLVGMGVWGTYMVELRIGDTSDPTITRIAWGITLFSSLLDIYSNWWVVYLRSMNEVLSATRIAVVAAAVRLVIVAALLLAGGGLLSLPLGSFVGSFIQRTAARRRCHKLLHGHPRPEQVNVKENLRILWPNTWRLGMQFLSSYLTVNANTAICLVLLGLGANAQYGLSVQLLMIVSGMAAVWTLVKWPVIGQLRARHDAVGLRRVLWPRVWLQTLTYVAGCAGILFFGPLLLKHFGGGKEVLPLGWFALLMLNGFFEVQFNIWGTLISTENRLPYLWPTVATNVISLALSFTLIKTTSLGLGALVLGPLIAGLLFNYWYWPVYSARTIGSTFFRFVFTGPSGSSTRQRDPALV